MQHLSKTLKNSYQPKLLNSSVHVHSIHSHSYLTISYQRKNQVCEYEMWQVLKTRKHGRRDERDEEHLKKNKKSAIKRVVSKEKVAGIKRKRFFFFFNGVSNSGLLLLGRSKMKPGVLFSNSAVAMREWGLETKKKCFEPLKGSYHRKQDLHCSFEIKPPQCKAHSLSQWAH